MPKKTAKKNKAEFVRSLSPTTPAKEVVAKGAEQKLTFSEQYVHQVRGRAKRAAKPNKTGRKKTPTKKTASVAAKTAAPAGRRGKAPDKKKRVLELHAANPSWTGHQLAEAAGSSLTYVYAVLRKPKRARAAQKPSAQPSPPREAKTVVDTLRVALANIESELAVRLALHLPRAAEAKKTLANLLGADTTLHPRDGVNAENLSA